jgi:hypothetical protein
MNFNRNIKLKRDYMLLSLKQQLLWILLLFGVFHPTFAQTFTPPVNSPLAKHEHPRLFFTKESLQEVKKYIDQYERESFQSYIEEINRAFNEAPSHKPRNFLLLDANNFAFLSYAVGSGLFSNYTFSFDAREYARKAYQHAEEISRRRKNKKMGGNKPMPLFCVPAARGAT